MGFAKGSHNRCVSIMTEGNFIIINQTLEVKIEHCICAFMINLPLLSNGL